MIKKLTTLFLGLLLATNCYGAGIGANTKLYFPGDENTLDVATVDGALEVLDDASNVGRILTQAGTGTLKVDQKKFGSASFWSDGNSDYIDCGDNANDDFGSGEFTIEGFCRFDTLPTSPNNQGLISKYTNGGGDRAWAVRLKNNSGTYILRFNYSTTGANLTVIESSSLGSLAVDTWYHYAVVRDGDTLRFFWDGTAVGTGSMSGVTIHNSTSDLYISNNAGEYFAGYQDEIRLSDTARYTTGFTPTTSEFEDDANTMLLLHCNTQDLSSEGGNTPHIPDFIGTAQLDTAVTKYGTDTSSLLLDGNSDYASIPDDGASGDFDFGSSNFTIDGQVNSSTLPGNGGVDGIISKWDGGTKKSWALRFFNDGGTYKLVFNYSTDGSAQTIDISSTLGTVNANTWYHFAIERYGNTFTYYWDGSVIDTIDLTGVTLYDSDYAVHIGHNSGEFWDGNMAHIRVQGVAEYEGQAFTPPTAPYSFDAPATDTQLFNFAPQVIVI